LHKVIYKKEYRSKIHERKSSLMI